MMKQLALTSLLLTPLHAADHTIKESNFETKLTLALTLIPTKTTVIKIEPEEWSDFEVREAVAHGSLVVKDEVLVQCDREDYDEKLAEAQKNVRSRKLTLKKAERELADLELTTPRSLEGEHIAFVEAKEALDYFTQIGRDLDERNSAQRLSTAKFSLENVEEEMKQLRKMYEEDGVTEETEEIILKRQRIAIDRAQFGLERAELSHKWNLEKTIPRKGVSLQRAYDAALLKYETAKLTLPRTLELKQIAVAQAQKADNEADEKLAKMKAASEFFTLKSPSSGMVYYGEIKDNKWTEGGTEKFLTEGGKLPSQTPLLTIIAPDTGFSLHTSVSQAERLQLTKGNMATMIFTGMKNQKFTAQLTQLALVPNGSGKYPVSFSVTLPEGSLFAPGMTGKATVVTYQNNKALIVPDAAITEQKGKSIVKVKMADGKSEDREVRIGKSFGGNTEILSGLEIDQVVTVPDTQ